MAEAAITNPLRPALDAVAAARASARVYAWHTVGSILGARLGAGDLPEKWGGALGDRLLSCVRDCNDNRISALAERTHRVAAAMTEGN